ncbi:hypothetical protein BaRGS_00030398, partial [Batillaria attramentaria]
QLLKELETERERRWKAEQAARKLADHVKEIQTKQEKCRFRKKRDCNQHQAFAFPRESPTQIGMTRECDADFVERLSLGTAALVSPYRGPSSNSL